MARQAVTCLRMMKSSSLEGIVGRGSAFYRPKPISPLGPDPSFHTGHCILTSLRTKLAPTFSTCQGPTVVSGVLSRYMSTSLLSCFLTRSQEFPLCCGSKVSSQDIMAHHLAQVSEECKAKKMYSGPRRAYKENKNCVCEQTISCGSLTTSYFHKMYKNRGLLGMSWHRLVWATQEKAFGLY